MPLSEKLLTDLESTLNKIATEMVLAQPGKDDGMVPVYALLREIEPIGVDDAIVGESVSNVQQAMDALMDAGQPFDQATLDYVTQFVSWAEAAIRAYRQGQEDEIGPFPPMHAGPIAVASHGATSDNAVEDAASRIATEISLAQAGTDQGLIPTYSLAGDLADTSAGNPSLAQSAQNLRAALGALLDQGKPWDQPTLDYATAFSAWAEKHMANLKAGKEVPAFAPMPGLETAPAAPAAPEAAPLAAATDAVEQGCALDGEVDVLLDLNLGADTELLSEFHSEALDHLEQIEAALLVLENSPRDKESLNSIFRSFHTIKGVSGFLHLVPIQALSHEVESLLDHARNAKLVLNSAMITAILQSRDAIQALVHQITDALEKGAVPDKIVPVSHLIKKVKQAAAEGLQRGVTAATETASAAPSAAAAAKETAQEAAFFGDSRANGAAVEVADEPAAAAEAPAAEGEPSAKATGERSTIRVNTLKLDNLMDTVGELVIVQSQLEESAREVATENSNLQRNLAQLSRITKELQHTSMALRMVPIKPTFQKTSRIVRDLARQMKKKVNYHVEGEDTELDRNVVEQIGDPLVHMVRNAIDHGIEDPTDRVASGKEETGNFYLKAYHMGSNIVIEVGDDGRGIDTTKVLAKARNKGLVPENQQFSREEIYQFLFLPGFSTAEKITEVSGRGVGMDVVKRNIEKLRGTIEIESELGKGSVFKIKLPLTMAIIDGLVVRVGADKFILPTTSVSLALRCTKEQITKIQGRAEVLDLRGKTVPIIRLHQRFNIPTEITSVTDGIVVIIESFGKLYGLLVDDMVSKQEVVIKSLGNLFHQLPGVAGGAILGDGTIALILDPSSLVAAR